jgi:hypothetical protein
VLGAKGISGTSGVAQVPLMVGATGTPPAQDQVLVLYSIN